MKLIITTLILFILLSCSKKKLPSTSLTFQPIKEVILHSANASVGPCEPSICINPTDPSHVVAASVLDNIYVSKDGGKTWSKNRLKSPYGVYGDPVVRIDNNGDVLYAHLSNPDNAAYSSQSFLDRIVVQRSTDLGETWNEGNFPPGDTLTDHDKHWLAVDPFTNTILMSWTEFDKYGSKEVEDKSRILFSKSDDGGLTWAPPLAISEKEGDCIDDDYTTEGCVPAIGTDGSYLLAWSYDEKIYFDRSTDKGNTWMNTDKVIANQPGGWTYDIPGISRCNGMPIIEVDHSNGPHRGTIYVNWSDQRNGLEDTDIFLAKSTDNGNTWSQPIRVNDDQKGAHQFLTWMDIDPITGYLYFVFYDRRGLDGTSTNVYLAFSTDGGSTFKNIKINEETFDCQPNVFFGDYNDISAYNGVVRPIWTVQEGRKLSVRTALINAKK